MSNKLADARVRNYQREIYFPFILHVYPYPYFTMNLSALGRQLYF